MLFTLKTLVAALAIAFTSWLAGKKPELAGFLIAMPLTSLLALVFTQLQHGDATSIRMAQSILVGVPLSLLFFVPFLLSRWWPLSFWLCFVLGLMLLLLAYALHQWLLPSAT